ncbi:MAG: MBL fold metallo-hydrolase [Ginsengibacter sp.]
MKRLTILFFFCLQIVSGQNYLSKNIRLMYNGPYSRLLSAKPAGQTGNEDTISVRIAKAGGNVYFLDCVNGFGGGNVAASIGEEGILLVDDMYALLSGKLEALLKSISDKPIRMIVNTHFHRDHIEGNKIFKTSSIIIAQENVTKRLLKNNSASAPTIEMMPAITFADSLIINFNGEEIKIIHFPNGHTDGDAIAYFTRSKVLHLGDMFFFGMFPAVYAEGGGDIKQLIVSLEKILSLFPADVHVIPGHGNLATMQDLADYVAMLKETVHIVESKIDKGEILEQMKKEKVLSKYDALGDGGAQTTDQYLTMLYKLLFAGKK